MANELATTENTQLAANHNDSDFNIPTGYICTVDTSSNEGKITIANALSDAESLADLGEKKFTLVDVVTTPGVRTRTGEVCTNVYLISDKGNIYMSQSDGIKRSAQQIVGLFNGDFGNGIEVGVIEKQLKSGNTLKTLHFYA